MVCDSANSNVIFTVIRIYRHAIYKYPNQKGRGGWSCQVKVNMLRRGWRRAEGSALTCSLKMVADFTGLAGLTSLQPWGISYIYYKSNIICCTCKGVKEPRLKIFEK